MGFVRALKGATNYLVVRNCKTDLCARIWCICEFLYAKEFELIPDKTIVTGPDTFAGDSISCDDAKSFDPSDKVKILNELMKNNSVNEINEEIDSLEKELKKTDEEHDEELKKKDEELKKKDE